MLDGRVHWTFTAADLPQWNDTQHPAVDITDISPAPAVGWLHSKGAFFPDPGPAPDEFHALDNATLTWQPLPAQEMDIKKFAIAGAALQRAEIETLFEMIFQLVSDVREIKAQPAITRAQLRDQMIAFYKTRI